MNKTKERKIVDSSRRVNFIQFNIQKCLNQMTKDWDEDEYGELMVIEVAEAFALEQVSLSQKIFLESCL